jgi:hypothetical protein
MHSISANRYYERAAMDFDENQADAATMRV